MKVRFVSEGKMKNLLIAHGYTVDDEWSSYSKTEDGMVGSSKRSAFDKVYNARCLYDDGIYDYSVVLNHGEVLVQGWLIEEEIYGE